jgi:integrase/recombinase XerD
MDYAARSPGPVVASPISPSPETSREIPERREELLERFRHIMIAEGKSPWTVKQYCFFATHFLEFANLPLIQVTPRHLDAYREHLVLNKHYSKASLYSTLRALAYLFRAFGLQTAEGIEVPRRPQRLPNFLTEEETHRLFQAQQGNPRNFAILHVLGYGGLRVGELCRLELDDVDLEHRLLRVRAGKGDKDRMVVIEDRTVDALKAWMAFRSQRPVGTTRLFGVSTETVERMVRETARSAGLTKRVTPHTLRHTLATTLLKKGLDIRFIQKQLGHASVATTQIYTHVDTESLQAAYRQAKPSY